MKSLIAFCLYCIISMHAAGQRQEIDSLLNILLHHTKEDTLKLNLLNDLAYNYYAVNADSGLLIAKQAIVLAKKLDNKLKLATAFSREALNYSIKGEDSLALNIYKQSLEIYSSAGYTKGMASVNHNMGLIYHNLSQYPTAIAHHEKAYSILNSLGNETGMANALNSIGVNYMYLSNYPKALEYYFKSMKISEQSGNELAIAVASVNIGLIYTHLSDFAKALEYYRRGLNIYEKKGNLEGAANTYGNIGNLYDNINKTDSSIACYEKQLTISKNIGYEKGVGSALINIGIDYTGMNKYEQAFPYVQKAIAVFKKNGHNSNLAIAYNQLAKIYANASALFISEQGIDVAQRFTIAAQLQLKSIELAKAAEDVNTQQTIWNDLSETYKKQHDYAKALDAFKQASVLKDSILNTDKRIDISRLELQHAFDQKEAAIKAENGKNTAIAEAKVKQQQTIRNAVIAGAGILFIAGVLVFIFYKRKRDAVEKVKEAELKAETADIEMKALRAQMNPHFIFNSLNSIGDYILRNDIKSASNYLTRFSKVMRLILENSEYTAVTLEDDLKVLALYMDVERMRLNNKFSYEIDVDDAIDKSNILIPPLILQPFVENSIWHGITKKDGEGKINICIVQKDDMLVCVIADNGIGRERSEIFKQEVQEIGKKSLGMKITNARISVINRLKNANASVEILNQDEGVRAEIKLPVEFKY